jgi:hypothetical protein
LSLYLNGNERNIVQKIGGESMYPNLRAEMARKRIMITQISSHLKLRHATVSDKINGKFRFYYDEAFEIKKTFFPEHNLEYLFEFEENEAN